MFLYHLGQEGENYASYFKEQLSNKFIWLDGSTIIHDLSDHKEDIRKMKLGYLKRKEMRDIYEKNLERVHKLLKKLQIISMLKTKNESRVKEKIILLQKIALSKHQIFSSKLKRIQNL